MIEYTSVEKFMALDSKTKDEIIKKHRKSDSDCGSSEVQIALLTANINSLTDHFSKNTKDVHSKRGLLKMFMKRKSLMNYLKDKNIKDY